jgi:hypothetical protein
MNEGAKMEKVQALIEKIKADLQDGKSDEEIAQSLLPLFGKDPEFDSEMVEHLAAIPHVKVAHLLPRMLQASDNKKVRKNIKRALYRLRSKGIAIVEVPPQKEGSILRPLEAEPPKGFGGGFDFMGQRFLLLVIPHTGRGWRVMQGVTSDTKGLIDFSGQEMTRKGFKAFFEEIQGESPFPLVEMEPSYVGFLFAQAYQLTLEKKGTPPHDYLSLKSEIEGIKKEYDNPLIYLYLQAGELAGDERVLKRGGDLLKADLFYSWRIVDEEIRPYADAVWEAEESKILLNQAQKEVRFQGVYQKALSELFSGERRLLYKQRLEEMAYILFKLRREEEARVSLAVALDLEKPLNLIQPNPFLFQLVIKSIFTLLAEAYEKKVKEPSLIVKP